MAEPSSNSPAQIFMIFVTTGTQAPFDRFVKMIDNIASGIDEEIIVQAYRDKYIPQNVKIIDFIVPDNFDDLFMQARLIVAHAGMGTIINAMQLGKPIVVMPRIAALGEHRSEHQIATARQMEQLGYAYVAHDEDALRHFITNLELKPLHWLNDEASASLIDSLSEFIG